MRKKPLARHTHSKSAVCEAAERLHMSALVPPLIPARLLYVLRERQLLAHLR